jgi:hypothetical protein
VIPKEPLYFGQLQSTRSGTLVQRATPVISNGMIFIRGQKHLFAIAEKAAPKEVAAK